MADNLNSLYQAKIATSNSKLASQTPLDAGHARIVASNINHMADEMAFVRVCSGMTSGAVATTATGWTLIGDFGSFPVTLRPDATPYRLRVRIAGTRSGSGNVTFRVVFSKPSNPRQVATEGPADQVLDFTCSSGTVGWLTADTANILQLPEDLMDDARTGLETVDNLTDNNPIKTYAPIVRCTVFAKRASGTGNATVRALYVAEFIA